MSRILSRVALSIVLAWLAAACSQVELAPHLKPLSKETMMLLGRKGMDTSAPIFIRVFKEESELEVWKQRPDGRYYPFKTYPICNWSGALGPKVTQGDRQAPEGFYTVSREQMNPSSQFYLAFNLGYPNAYDRANARTGEFLMVHGKCKSAGCYAMTDALIEEIYGLAREAFIGGQDVIPVHAMPFRMTDANMARHKSDKWYPFWKTLKEGYDYFELTRQVPTVGVCNRHYVVNVAAPGGLMPARLDPQGPCPALIHPKVEAFVPRPGDQIAQQRVTVPGPKTRALANATPIPGTTGSTSLSGLASSLGGYMGLSKSTFGFSSGK